MNLDELVEHKEASISQEAMDYFQTIQKLRVPDTICISMSR